MPDFRNSLISAALVGDRNALAFDNGILCHIAMTSDHLFNHSKNKRCVVKQVRNESIHRSSKAFVDTGLLLGITLTRGLRYVKGN